MLQIFVPRTFVRRRSPLQQAHADAAGDYGGHDDHDDDQSDGPR